MSRNKIVLIGPRYNNNSSIGGIVVLFEDLVKFCEKSSVNYTIIDTNMSNYRNKVTGLIKVLFLCFKNIRKASHVSLHGTAKDYLIIAPFIVLLSKLFRKEISLRKFAGSFFDIYEKSNFISKLLYRFSLRNADYLFFETKFLVEKFNKFNDKVYWLPNSRTKSLLEVRSFVFRKKIVFISQVKATKGIFELIEASKYFDQSYCFDVYGPIMEDSVKEALDATSSISYKGVLEPSLVNKTLLDYDVLVLPTYHEGEGYPGIIIEAFSNRLPVISSNWNSIPEIVHDGYNGFLVEPRSVESLVSAIKKFDDENYQELALNAYKSFDSFDSDLVSMDFFKTIRFNLKMML